MKVVMFVLASTALVAAPALAQATSSATPAQPATTAPANPPSVAAGAAVYDASGAQVGTIDSVSGGNAVVSTGSVKAALPMTSFAKGDKGLVISMSKADLEAAVSKATKPAEIAVGTPVNDQSGGKVGTVAAVAGDLVTVATANSKAQLPKSAFAQGPNGLVIAMTATQLDVAAKAAGGGKTGG
jgi:rRNA processing protein Gar1